MIVEATRIVTTQGQYAGEEGVGYQWGRSTLGDFSAATRGHIQGRHEPCLIEILVEGAEIVDTEGFGLLLWLPVSITKEALTAEEALRSDYARVFPSD